jgi:hypothetical protein
LEMPVVCDTMENSFHEAPYPRHGYKKHRCSPFLPPHLTHPSWETYSCWPIRFYLIHEAPRSTSAALALPRSSWLHPLLTARLWEGRLAYVARPQHGSGYHLTEIRDWLQMHPQWRTPLK